MKKLSKLLAVVLAAVLLTALAVPAFAAGTITILNPGNTVTYDAYKIFNVEEDASGELVYKIPANSAWLSLVQAEPGLVLTPDNATTPTEYTVTKLTSFNPADFASHLKAAIPSGVTADATGTSGANDASLSLAVTDNGYYLVTSTAAGTMQERASLVTVYNGEVDIQNKNDMPFDKEVEVSTGVYDKESGVQLGDTVNFRISGKVPTIPASSTYYIYNVEDRMDPGLAFDITSVTVTVGGNAVTLTEITDPGAVLTGDQIRYHLRSGSTTEYDGFDLSLEMFNNVNNNVYNPDDPIVITYSATVTADAIDHVMKNKAVLRYGDQNGITQKDSETNHYTSSIIIDKFETGAPEHKLAGADFRLYRDNAGTPEYYKLASGAVTWTSTASEATVITTNAEGSARIDGLPDGTYYLEETAAPTGFVQLTQPIEIVIDGSDSVNVGLTAEQIHLILSNFANVGNTPGSQLPSTGGIGTTIFYIVGGILVLAAAAVIVVFSRKRSSNN